MVEHRIWIRFTESCDFFVLCEHRGELGLETLAARASGPKSRHLPVLIVVKHWHFSLAAPAPEHSHRGRSILSVVAKQSEATDCRNIAISLSENGATVSDRNSCC